jgi:hypothetical protein
MKSVKNLLDCCYFVSKCPKVCNYDATDLLLLPTLKKSVSELKSDHLNSNVLYVSKDDVRPFTVDKKARKVELRK